jgi:hypothetical protein
VFGDAVSLVTLLWEIQRSSIFIGLQRKTSAQASQLLQAGEVTSLAPSTSLVEDFQVGTGILVESLADFLLPILVLG